MTKMRTPPEALLLVDIQNDFMPFGALPVADGDAVVEIANRLGRGFEIVVATQDWHPADHGSFAANHPGMSPGDFVQLGGVDQVLWPSHCVQGTPGASFHSSFDVTPIRHVTRKGTDAGIDSYSAFFDNGHLKATDLHDYLKGVGVESLTILGLATDYCVKFTVLDGLRLGYRMTVVSEGCRAVNLEPGDDERAFRTMSEAGAEVV